MGRLRVVSSPIEDFEPACYDLVNAQFSLPFIRPSRFVETLGRLQRAVHPNGMRTVTFVGPNDEWNEPGGELTFTTREDVERFFEGWQVIELTEIEEDGTTATGGRKHRHVIHLIARKNGPA